MRRGVQDRGARLRAALPFVAALLLSCGSGNHGANDGGAPREAGPGAPLTITTNSLPGGMVDVKYHAGLAATGGLRPLTWRVADGSLPPGLSLNPTTGAIDGLPTQDGSFAITIEVTDAYVTPQTDSAALTIRIQPRPGPVSVATTSLPKAQVGVAYSQTLQGAGGALPYAWSLDSGALPDGLRLSFTINGNDFVWTIGGTPTTVGVWNFVVRVNDSLTPSQTATQPLSITVDPPPPVSVTTSSLPEGTVGHGYHGALAATGGLPPYTWQVVAGTLPAGLSLPPTATDGGTYGIVGTPTTTGTSTFTVRANDSYHPTNYGDKQLSITVKLPQQDAGVQDDAAAQDAAQNDAAQSDAAQSDAAQQDAAQEDAQEDAQQDAPQDV